MAASGTEHPGDGHPGDGHPFNGHSSKTQWRAQLRSARSSVSPQQHALEADALAKFLLASDIVREAGTLCGYVPVGREPGTAQMLDGFLTMGVRLLLPVVEGELLNWVVYSGREALTEGAYGLAEPAGSRLGSAAIFSARVVIVPALAVDHTGTRLGRGKGYYDRALRLAAPDAVFIAMVRDEELVTHLPAEPHDVPMTWAVTPGRGFVRLG
ncbi:MAG: 5-formyltetrahydrofolate cyclo-ligase [Pseudonocardiaceae bacterium]|nr:5-formyltetrahydrofolate cyclo-ligase [Pseudonocardiaceae bacterium]